MRAAGLPRGGAAVRWGCRAAGLHRGLVHRASHTLASPTWVHSPTHPPTHPYPRPPTPSSHAVREKLEFSEERQASPRAFQGLNPGAPPRRSRAALLLGSRVHAQRRRHWRALCPSARHLPAGAAFALTFCRPAAPRPPPRQTTARRAAARSSATPPSLGTPSPVGAAAAGRAGGQGSLAAPHPAAYPCDGWGSGALAGGLTLVHAPPAAAAAAAAACLQAASGRTATPTSSRSEGGRAPERWPAGAA